MTTRSADVHLDSARVVRVTHSDEHLTIAVGRDGQDTFVADTLLRLPAKHRGELADALRRLV